VKAIFAGEVRWSETSDADKAVWAGRSRGRISASDTHYFWENLWDTARIGGVDRHRVDDWRWSPEHRAADGHVKMFQNFNVGAYHLCNLQVGGQLVGDHSMEVHQMYATVDRPPARDETILAVLTVGCRRVSEAHLTDLIVGHPVGVAIPERQCFAVELVWRAVREPIQIVMHLEGPSPRYIQ
jgi:hypothetical protein